MSAQYVIRLKALEKLVEQLMKDNEKLKSRVSELESRPIPSGRPRKPDQVLNA